MKGFLEIAALTLINPKLLVRIERSNIKDWIPILVRSLSVGTYKHIPRNLSILSSILAISYCYIEKRHSLSLLDKVRLFKEAETIIEEQEALKSFYSKSERYRKLIKTYESADWHENEDFEDNLNSFLNDFSKEVELITQASIPPEDVKDMKKIAQIIREYKEEEKKLSAREEEENLEEKKEEEIKQDEFDRSNYEEF